MKTVFLILLLAMVSNSSSLFGQEIKSEFTPSNIKPIYFSKIEDLSNENRSSSVVPKLMMTYTKTLEKVSELSEKKIIWLKEGPIPIAPVIYSGRFQSEGSVQERPAPYSIANSNSATYSPSSGQIVPFNITK